MLNEILLCFTDACMIPTTYPIFLKQSNYILQKLTQ